MRRGGAGGGPSSVRRESGAARPSPARAPPVPAAKSCAAALRLGAAAMVRPGGRPGLVPSHGGRAAGPRVPAAAAQPVSEGGAGAECRAEVGRGSSRPCFRCEPRAARTRCEKVAPPPLSVV